MLESVPGKKVLILAANPLNTDRLRLDKEVEEIRQTLQLSAHRDRHQIEARGAVRSDDLQQYLFNLKPQIVHFSGHGGGEQGLALEDEQGNLHLVSTEALGGLFKLFGGQIDCVVLNACYAAVQAEAIVQHIPYVVGMNTAIGDQAARKFAQGFYRGIWEGRSIDDAFGAGVNAIALEGIPETLTPVLLRRADLDQPVQPSPTPSSMDPKTLESPEGQVRIDSRFYIPSFFEQRCYEEVKKPGSLIRIKSPHKMGKSSLMVRVLAYADQWGYRKVSVNLEEVNRDFFQNPNQFMQWFCASVGDSLDVDVDVEQSWRRALGANDNSTRYFERHLLKGAAQPLVLAIDNFDRIFKYPDIETDFCGLLRGWYERSRSHEFWDKLRLMIVYSQDSLSQRDINQSPFNVGLPIELGEFTVAQVQALITLHGLDWPESWLEQFMGLIGGHPYLVRLALYHLALGDLTLEAFLHTAPTEAGIYQRHLVGHLQALEKSPDLGAAIKTVVESATPVRLRAEEAAKLDRLGLVVRVENQVQPRCRLYRQYFRDRLGA